MQAILKLDLAGQPRGWLTLHEAISAYARGDVVYGIGDVLPPVFGGIQRFSGERSRIDLQPIIALEGRIVQGFTPPLCNRTLFRRDDHRCLYCGTQHSKMLAKAIVQKEGDYFKWLEESGDIFKRMTPVEAAY